MPLWHFNPSPFWSALVPSRPASVPDPVAWAESAFHFHPDPLQAAVLRSTSSRLILCCTRQWGKSTITALKALHHAWFHPYSLVLIAAPSLRQSAEWLDKTKPFLRLLGVCPRTDGHNPHSLLLPNRSRLVCLPGVPDTVRGFSSVSLLLIDEAALVTNQLYQALNPTLAVSRGSLFLMSTPGPQTGFFYETWHSSSPEWERHHAPAQLCPRIPPDFLASQRLALGDLAFRREYECDFSAPPDQLLSRELLERAFVDVPPFNGARPLWPL